MFDDVRLSHYFTSGFLLFSRDEPFLLGPTRTQPQVLSKAAADGDRWHPYINRTLFYWSSFSVLFWYSFSCNQLFFLNVHHCIVRKRRVVQQPGSLLFLCPAVWYDSHMLSGSFQFQLQNIKPDKSNQCPLNTNHSFAEGSCHRRGRDSGRGGRRLYNLLKQILTLDNSSFHRALGLVQRWPPITWHWWC